MDTIIINNIIYPIDLDSINVKIDYSVIQTELSLLRDQNRKEFQELRHTIQDSYTEEGFLHFVSNDALFATITTILVFSLGIIINILIKRVERNKRRREIRSIVKQHITQGVNTFKILQKEYHDFSNNTTIDSGIPLTPPKVLSGDFQRLLRLDSKDLYNSITDKKSFSNIESQVISLTNIIHEVQFYHNRVLKRSNGLRDKLGYHLNLYVDTLANFVEHEQANTPNFQETEPYQKINDALSKFHNEIAGKRALQKFYDQILRPLQEYLVSSNLFRSHKLCRIIADQGKKFSLLYNELNVLTNELKDQYLKFSQLLSETIESLESNIKEFNRR